MIETLKLLANPWAWLALVAVAAGSFLGGMHEQTIRFEAAQKAGQDRAITDAVKLLANQHTENATLSNALNTERSGREKDQRDFEEKLAAAKRSALTEINCPTGDPPSETGGTQGPAAAPPMVAGGSCRLSTDGMRLWNAGLALGVDAAHRRQFAHAEDSAAGPVEIEDAIDNVGDNATLLGECRERELAWQVKACRNGWYSGAPCDDRIKEFGARK